jgi:hypothetical protein
MSKFEPFLNKIQKGLLRIASDKPYAAMPKTWAREAKLRREHAAELASIIEKSTQEPKQADTTKQIRELREIFDTSGFKHCRKAADTIEAQQIDIINLKFALAEIEGLGIDELAAKIAREAISS